ncbi:MAG: DUF2567 domain-containing protein [Pseudonocardiaceae bacterium]
MTAAQRAPAAPESGDRSSPTQPGVLVRADLVAALVVWCAVAVSGLPLGWLWSRLAPPEFVVPSARATGSGGVLPIVGQSEHRFDDMAVFLLLGLAAGVLTGAALWLLRQRRGPVVLVVAMLGSLAAAWLAMRIGLALAAARYPELASIGVAFPRAPVLESGWVVIAQPFAATVAYCVTTAWNGTDDLGRECH